ncbi:MarR family winged helix-turn-helix transcriptional regulator [Sphingomicrobium arenosum]|uniref:MarR family winged helix-turn-helix transcriptional regulator n=1 Tax=Sphingomicrobium arenosum TaxID=2233861 RepID=UPI002240F14B|nr:MarR family transcriptional regulator [Sphingomicrobium arenosum]
MAGESDYLREAGGEALGGRLRRLSERIDREADAIYRDLGVTFSQRWFGIVNQLRLLGQATVGDIAARLGITHASVSETRRALERAGLIEGVADPEDARRRLLRLTAEGEAVVRRLAPTWEADQRATAALVAEVPGLMAAIDALEDALDRQSLQGRAAEERAATKNA